MGRRPNTESRRREIVAALRAELGTVGYERATIKSIAARAGLAAGLVHYHFASKQEILLAVVDDLIADAEARASTVWDGDDDGTPGERLRAYARARVGLGPSADDDQVRAWVALIAEAMGYPPVRERVAAWLSADHARVTALFEAAGARPAAEHASMLLAAILGSFSLHSLGLADVPAGYAEPGIERWLAAVLAPGPSGRITTDE